MANNSKKYVSLTRLSDFLDNIKDKYSQIGHKHTMSDITDISDITNITVDSALSSTSTNPVQNKVIDAEFDAIATAMGALENAIDGKAPASHNHDDRYYTEAEINDKLSNINTDISDINTNISDINTSLIDIDVIISKKVDIDHNHDDLYDAKGSADTALSSAKSYTDTKVSDLIAGTDVDNKISTHDTSSSAHSDIRELVSDLATRLDGFSGGGSGNGAIPDWNQSNPAAADYIKNRPFYTGSVEKEIYDVNAELTAVSGALTSMQVSATEYLHSVNASNLDYELSTDGLVEGKQYIVVIDGNRYEYTAKSMQLDESFNYALCTYLGDAEAFLSQDIANFTVGFANMAYPNGFSNLVIGCKTTSASAPASFKIYSVEEEVKQLDPKYYERLAWVEEGAKTNVYEFDGNLDNEEYYDNPQGGYLVRTFNTYVEPEVFIGAIGEFTYGGVEQTAEFDESMIMDMSNETGFPSYRLGSMGLVISQEYMGMPVGCYMVYVPDYIVISKITFTQNIFSEPDVIHKIDPKFLPAGAGGSVEIDNTLSVEGAAADAKAVGDALANINVSGGVTSWNDLEDKPFGDDVGRNNIITISYEFTTGSNGVDPYTESSTFTFVEGETYFVDYDGTPYECVAYYAEGPNTTCIGNGTIADVAGGGNEPFFATVFDGNFMVFSETEGTHDISVYTVSGGLKKLDKKYLPEISWNDLTDKPFGDETVRNDILTISHEFIQDDFGNIIYDEPTTFSFIKGERYFVDYDGITYECIAYSANDVSEEFPSYVVSIGNPALEGFSGGNGEPFLITIREGILYVGTETEGIHDISVYTIDNIKKLDKKYLPEITWNDLPFNYTEGESFFEPQIANVKTVLNATEAYALYSFSDLDSEYKTLVKDAWYKVVFNETEYFCKCITGNVATSDENTLFLGNASIQSIIGTINGLEYTGYENKKEPFCLRLNHYDNGMRALMLFTKPELAGWNSISVHKIDVEQIQDMFIVDSAYNDIASRYNNFYYANVSTTNYSNHQILGIGNGLKIVKVSDEVPSRDFFIGKSIYLDLVNTKALKSNEEAELRLTITEDFFRNLVDIVAPEVADEVASALGDAFIIGEYFMIIPQNFEAEESGINITAGVWAIDQSSRLDTIEYAMRIGDGGKTINSSLIPRNIARLTDVAQKITAPTTAQAGDILTFDGTNWVSISKADLIAEIIAALPSAEGASF